MDPFPAVQGHHFVISLLDVFSIFMILFLTLDHTASTVEPLPLPAPCGLYFGVPSAILSDQYMGPIWAQLQELLGCWMLHNSLYHPQGNSIVERWQLTLNSAEHNAHSFTPSKMQFKTTAHLPVDFHPLSAISPLMFLPSDHLAWLQSACHHVAQHCVAMPKAPQTNPFQVRDLMLVASICQKLPQNLATK